MTVVKVTSSNAGTSAKRNVDIEVENEAQKINKAENIYYDYKDKAPVTEKVVEESAMQDLDEASKGDAQTENKEDNVVTEIVKKEFRFVTPLAKDTYEIADTFSDKYRGFNQSYIETIIFKVNFKTGTPGIIYKVNKDDTPVYAMEDGEVISIGDNTSKNAGYSIIIQHDNGVKTEYYCLKKAEVASGAKVKKGQKIALAGNIGSTLLKNELRIYMLDGDRIVNPEDYIV